MSAGRWVSRLRAKLWEEGKRLGSKDKDSYCCYHVIDLSPSSCLAFVFRVNFSGNPQLFRVVEYLLELLDL